MNLNNAALNNVTANLMNKATEEIHAAVGGLLHVGSHQVDDKTLMGNFDADLARIEQMIVELRIVTKKLSA